MREILIAIGGLSIVFISFYYLSAHKNECTKKGGVLLKSAMGFTCVEAKEIK